MRDSGARAPRPALLATAAVSCALLFGGCQEPTIDVRAVWVDVVREDDGGRRLNVYDRGERLDARLGSSFGDAPSVHLQLGPRGRRILIREPQLESVSVLDRAAVVDLDDGRTFVLEVPKATIDADDPVRFTDSGTALVWRDDGELRVFPLEPGLHIDEDESGFHRPLRTSIGSAGWQESARDAPILFVLDVESKSLFAARYPIEPEDGDRLEALEWVEDETNLLENTFLRPNRDCAQQILECEVFRAVDPDGWAVTFRIDPKQKRWGRWSRGFPTEPIAELELPQDLAGAEGLAMLGAIDRDVLVFGDNTRMFRWDIGRAHLDVFPLVGDPGFSIRTAERGRVLFVISNDGAITRVDGDGIRLVNAERSSCFMTAVPVVSPNGEWFAWSCLDTQGDAELDRGVVIRVSEGTGLRRYAGIVMGALAIDDAGGLLLQSEDTVVADGVDGVEASQVPHSLYTLDADDVLRREDDLEPSPEPVILPSGGLSTYLQARALDP